MRIYGLKTCDTCRKAAKALGVPVSDVREHPLSEGQLAAFHAQFGEALVNRRSTTWRGLSESVRQSPELELLRDHPALMKRPVIEDDAGTLYLGWGSDVKARLL